MIRKHLFLFIVTLIYVHADADPNFSVRNHDKNKIWMKLINGEVDLGKIDIPPMVGKKDTTTAYATEINPSKETTVKLYSNYANTVPDKTYKFNPAKIKNKSIHVALENGELRPQKGKLTLTGFKTQKGYSLHNNVTVQDIKNALVAGEN